MNRLDIALYLVGLLPFVTPDSIINEGLRFKQTNLFGTRPSKSIPKREQKSIVKSPVEYMKTPNYDVIFLSEENSNPIWRQYADLFQPIDFRNVQRIEVSYGTNSNGFQTPSISLGRSDLESVLAMLGGKKHIIVLRPRNCKSHSAITGIGQSLMNQIKKEFLHKLLQQPPKKPSPTQQMGSDVMDPIIKRILEILRKADQKMIEDVKQKFEGKSSGSLSEKRMFSSGYAPARKWINLNNRNRYLKNKHSSPKPNANSPADDTYKDPCNEGYVFLLENQENSMDPHALNDLLLRVLKVVTKSE